MYDEVSNMRITALMLICILISIYSTEANAIEAMKKDLIYDKIIPYNFSNISIGVIGENEYDVPLKIIENNNKIDIQNGTVYKYFDVWIGTYRIKKAIIKYRVNNSWIEDNNIDNIEILISNKTNKKWDRLENKIINKDSNYTYLESETKYLSSFVIVGLNKKESEESDTITLTGDISEVEITEDEGKGDAGKGENINTTLVEKSPGFGFGIILAVVFITYIRMNKNRRNRDR